MAERRKLTDEQARAALLDPRPAAEVAAELGVTQKTVSRIRTGETYKHIDRTLIPKSGDYLVGDCLEVMRRLPSNSFAGVITSPPYNKANKFNPNSTAGNGRLVADGYAGSQSAGRGKRRADDDMPPAEYALWQREVVGECLRLVGDSGVVFYNTQFRAGNLAWDMRDDIFNLGVSPPSAYGVISPFRHAVRQTITWDRAAVHNFGGGAYLPFSSEVIFLLAGKDWRIPDRLRGVATADSPDKAADWKDIWRIPPDRNNGHPASFPVELARRCALLANGPVLDPFAGSGTVGIAAEMLGLEYVLIDLSAGYKRVFEKRRDELRASRPRRLIE